MGDLTVITKPTPPKKKKKSQKAKKPSKPFFTAGHVKAALPFVDAGLELLTNVAKVKPYARALRVVTAAGSSLMPDDSRQILDKIRAIRTQIVELEKAAKQNARPLRQLRAQMDAYIDLLIQCG